MKKIIFILVVSITFVSWTEAKEHDNNWTELNLKGKVKSMYESKYSAIEKTGEMQKGERKDSTIYIFDDKGNKIEKK